MASPPRDPIDTHGHAAVCQPAWAQQNITDNFKRNYRDVY